jgi:DNA polymerase
MDYKEFEENKSKCRSCSVGLVYNCVVLSDGCKSNPKVIIIGEAPGSEEIINGKPFVGKAGKLLRSTLEKYGFNNSNSLITNTLPCRPENNKFPKDNNLVYNCVSKWLNKEIEITNPKYILLIGSTPTKFLLNKIGITKLRGQWFEYNGIKCMPTYHPSFVLRKQYMAEGKTIRELFERDIIKVAESACIVAKS